MPNAFAQVYTPQAARYLTQLCKHFEHKLPVTHTSGAGTIGFPSGECRLHAEGGELNLTLEAGDQTSLAQLRDVVERHLTRFAFREELGVQWREE
jgi:hypothetical protein